MVRGRKWGGGAGGGKCTPWRAGSSTDKLLAMALPPWLKSVQLAFAAFALGVAGLVGATRFEGGRGVTACIVMLVLATAGFAAGIVFSGLAIIASPACQSWWNSRRTRKEHHKQLETERKLRGNYAQSCHAWDAFHRAANELRGFISELEAPGRSADWQTDLERRLNEALALAAALPDGDRDTASGKLRWLQEAARGGEPAIGRLVSLADQELAPWVHETGQRYRRLKQAAGMPT